MYDWFDGGPTLPRNMRDVRDYPMFTKAMLRRGWKEPRNRKFLEGNLLRVSAKWLAAYGTRLR